MEFVRVCYCIILLLRIYFEGLDLRVYVYKECFETVEALEVKSFTVKHLFIAHNVLKYLRPEFLVK
jgi:hypothetical protein